MKYFPCSAAMAACLILAPAPILAAGPQEEAASAHLQLTAFLNGEIEELEVPGMPDPKAQILSTIATTFPETALRWEVGGFNITQPSQPMACTSTESAFEAESLDAGFRYYSDHTLSCFWGKEPILLTMRATIEDKDGKRRWSNTEILEIDTPSTESY